MVRCMHIERWLGASQKYTCKVMCILNTIPCCSEYTVILCGCTIDLLQEMLLYMSYDLYIPYVRSFGRESHFPENGYNWPLGDAAKEVRSLICQRVQ